MIGRRHCAKAYDRKANTSNLSKLNWGILCHFCEFDQHVKGLWFFPALVACFMVDVRLRFSLYLNDPFRSTTSLNHCVLFPLFLLLP